METVHFNCVSGKLVTFTTFKSYKLLHESKGEKSPNNLKGVLLNATELIQNNI